MSSGTVALIGPMGSGKSSVGRRLARLLDAPFTDTDARIATEHASIPELFATLGEPAFRRLERQVVAAALAAPGVVSLGGGAVLDPATREDLRGCTVVLLDVSEEAVASRLRPGSRPLLTDGLDTWRRIAAERSALYASLADVTADTSRRPIARIAEELAAELRARAERPLSGAGERG